MVLCSTHARLTRTSSDLRTLSAILLPPSPVLEAGDFLISSTSGEIPILLEATTHACDFPSNMPVEPPGLCESRLTTRNIKGPTHRNEATLKNWVYRESVDMCITAGLSNGRYCDAESHPFGRHTVQAVSGGLQNGMHFAYNELCGHGIGLPSIRGNCLSSIFGKQAYIEGLHDSQVPYHQNTTEPSTTTTVTAEENLDSDQLVTFATFHTYSTLPTPTFAPPSPSLSADVISLLSSPVSRHSHRRPLERAGAVRFPGRPRSPRSQVNEAEVDSMRHTLPSLMNCPRRQSTNAAHTVVSQSCMADTGTLDAAHPFMKHVALPEELLWLKHMKIELWIDQEGFRAVRPCMQLIGYSPRSRSLHPYEPAENAGSNATAGVAEFMPTKREVFVFHYATLDSPPTLRMVSVANGEARDYVSKQATLSVKSNGVYTVLGTEAHVVPMLNNDVHGSRLQNMRLRWKFDYLVSDRKVDGAGKTLPGEKTMTPLTFSCSPYLFHPSQGKKTGLMHIMKKNLVPRLVSQKLEPPTYISSHGVLSQASRYLSTGGDSVMHARSRSDVSAKSGRYPLTRSPLDTYEGIVRDTNHIPRARRRRASSAGENGVVILRERI